MKEQKETGAAGTLYVVATPIGNLEDITLRAVRILREVDLVASEDTRHTRKLLSHLDIHTPLFSYYKEREKERAAQLIDKLAAGLDVALVSDAGTPAISDPGGVLVEAAHAAGIKVVAVPGPSALTAALSVAGLVDKSFVFYGFLPASRGQRRRFLESHGRGVLPMVFYESPKRIVEALADCLAILGERQVFLGRELTKLHEETLRGGLAEIVEQLAGRPQIKGEFVAIVAGAPTGADRPDPADVEGLLRWYKESGSTLKAAVKALTADLGLGRSEVYRQALEVWREEEETGP